MAAVAASSATSAVAAVIKHQKQSSQWQTLHDQVVSIVAKLPDVVANTGATASEAASSSAAVLEKEETIAQLGAWAGACHELLNAMDDTANDIEATMLTMSSTTTTAHGEPWNNTKTKPKPTRSPDCLPLQTRRQPTLLLCATPCLPSTPLVVTSYSLGYEAPHIATPQPSTSHSCTRSQKQEALLEQLAPLTCTATQARAACHAWTVQPFITAQLQTAYKVACKPFLVSNSAASSKPTQHGKRGRHNRRSGSKR